MEKAVLKKDGIFLSVHSKYALGFRRSLLSKASSTFEPRDQSVPHFQFVAV
jgi:hypothetical protein